MFAVIIYRIQPGREPQLFVKRIVSGLIPNQRPINGATR